jgi:hypothetical protein
MPETAPATVTGLMELMHQRDPQIQYFAVSTIGKVFEYHLLTDVTTTDLLVQKVCPSSFFFCLSFLSFSYRMWCVQLHRY